MTKGPIVTKDHVLKYLIENPDRFISLQQLTEKLGFSDSLHSRALENIRKKYSQLERVNPTTYVWHGLGTRHEVTVIAIKNDGKMVVRNDETDQLYLMQSYDF